MALIPRRGVDALTIRDPTTAASCADPKIGFPPREASQMQTRDGQDEKRPQQRRLRQARNFGNVAAVPDAFSRLCFLSESWRFRHGLNQRKKT